MKSPAFQFYPGDFLAGVGEMTQAERGAYITLLSYQWTNDTLPNEQAILEQMACGPVTPKVRAKFSVTPEGRLVNPRLEIERQKQAEYREMQRQKGIASSIAKKLHSQPDANRTPTENQPRLKSGCPAVPTERQPDGQPEGNSSSSSSSSTPTSEKTSPDGECGAGKPRRTPTERSPAGGLDEVRVFFASNGGTEVDALNFFDHYEANGWMQGKVPMKQWKAAARRWCRGNANGQRAFHTNGSRHPPARHAEDKQIQENIPLPMLN